MSLLRKIQQTLLEPGQEIGPVLLKLRLLAARVGSDALGEWVKHESEGYPPGVDLPAYRYIGVSYIADFSGPFNSGIKNAPIPNHLIERYAGKHWVEYAVRQSIAGIDVLVNQDKEEGSLQIEASNLILLLQGNVYEGYACNGVRGRISRASLVEIQHAVRNRILELTIEMENSVPGIGEISSGGASPIGKERSGQEVTNITNQIIHGHYTSINNSGAGSNISAQISVGDQRQVQTAMEAAGIPAEDAAEFASILASEQPENEEQPFGAKAKRWLSKSMPKALDGTWKAGLAVATEVLSEAAKQYYGLK